MAHGKRSCPTDRLLDVSARIADHLLDVQRRVNAQIDATQSELLPDVRRQLGHRRRRDRSTCPAW